MRVLLSIKPKYAEKIFNGTKRFEFRRSIFKSQDITTILVYASSPVKKVIGEFQIDKIILEDLDSLWEKTKEHAGIDKRLFFEYFQKKEKGFAIKIGRTKKYKQPKCLLADFNVSPPQSFTYVQ